MSPDFRDKCVKKSVFPRPIAEKPDYRKDSYHDNRPGLSEINYRIGSYTDILKAIYEKLNKDTILSDWTHREADDPGIALLQGASILADILTFYQNQYANEAYLRTAKWRENIADLVRITGYLLSPGTGGEATLVFAVRGSKSVTVPAGFPVKAQLIPIEQPADFETKTASIAYPWLNQFYLYRPRLPMPDIDKNLDHLEIHQVENASDSDSIAAIDIRAGDRLMLIPDTSMYDEDKTFSAQEKPEILVVTDVKTEIDRRVIYFKGGLSITRGKMVTAYKIGRSFNHLGHNAPSEIIKYSETDNKLSKYTTFFERNVGKDHKVTGPQEDFYSIIKTKEMPLDQELDDLATGSKFICEGMVNYSIESSAQTELIKAPSPGGGSSSQADKQFTVVRKVETLRSDSLTWGDVTNRITVLSLYTPLIKNPRLKGPRIEIRKTKFHEVIGPKLVLRAPSIWNDGAISNNELSFYGTYKEVCTLMGRKIILEHNNGRTAIVSITDTTEKLPLTGRDKQHKWMWNITLGSTPLGFKLKDFKEANPAVTVYGNLVDADQGKTEKEVVLGSADAGQKFQTFKLPKAPLTYHNQADESPPEVPELKIYVDDQLWQRSVSLFGKGPEDRIYIVREDSSGNSWVQFGDGKTGSRLPSGIENVKAVFRTGIGAYGELKPETTVQPGAKLDDLDKILMPESASGGSEPEVGENAMESAPLKTQSLGRLVSIKDFESEALSISGVIKAHAQWQVDAEKSVILLTILLSNKSPSKAGQIQSLLNKYNVCRGAQRYTVEVVQGKRLYIFLDILFGLDSRYKQENVMESIKKVIGIMGDTDIDGTNGLFGYKKRQFGQKAYASRIEGYLQNIEGVVWVKVKALHSLGESDNPVDLDTKSAAGQFAASLDCDEQHLFSLYKDHLKLSVVKEEQGKGC